MGRTAEGWKRYYTSLDAEVDGRLADIRSITKTRDSYEYALLKKNGQLMRFNAEQGTNADTVILYFHDSGMYSEERIRKSMELLPKMRLWKKDDMGNSYLSEELITVFIKHIICITKDGTWKEFDM